MKRLTLGLFFILAPLHALADALVPGNILVSTDDVVYETTTDGQVVQSFATQYPGGSYPATEYARDVAVDDDGNISIYNGTFTPYMSTYDPVSGTWTHVDTVDWDTANNTSYGGVDVAGNKVYVTDMRTTDAENGVVEFDTSTGAVSRFAAGTDAIDLTIGLDGLLYVLSPGGSPEGRIIDVYDPATYTFIRTIQLTPLFGWNGHRSVAVDHNGDVFIADWDGEIHHVTAAGDLVQTIAPPCDLNGREIFCSFNDIDISPSGQLVLGSRFGEIFVTDTSFSTVSRFEVGTRSAFVEFVPEPPAPTEVDMDVRPGRDPNKINLSRKVNVWIAILSNEGFDATTEVDAYSVRLGAAGAAINRSPRYSDVDGDGDRDLRLRFTVAEIGIVCGDTELSMTGMLVDGTEIVASDAIITRGCN